MKDNNQLPEPELGYIKTDISNQPAFSARQMREAMKHALRPDKVPMTDDKISLEAHNADDRDWNDLRFRNSWHEGFLEGARFAEAHHGITAQAKKETP